jgi:hypothetical protein
MQVRAPLGILAAYDARVEHLVSVPVMRCHPCGVPRSSPSIGLSGIRKLFQMLGR